VEKMLDEAAKTAEVPPKPTKPVSSTSTGFNESFASSAPPGNSAASTAPRKN
jgi:hypothetical protein